MLKRSFSPKLIYLAVVYLRMSSDQQNKRSPEQQLEEIQRRLKALGYPWTIVKIYRDDATSGRYLRKRKGYQQMMQDIKTGAVKVDLILVDTLERFGRVEELQGIRKELYEKHGVLVLTGDSNFADPNTPQGKALGMFEAMRATEDGRIKAHNVLRGKRDAAQQGHWPGGSPPFGYKLKSIMKEVNGRQEVDYCVLVPNPESNWIAKLLFDKAYETGWGQIKLTHFLNDHPEIPAKLKPFQAPSVGYWLDSAIYSGELVWAQNCTGIVDDMRVLQPNAEEDIVRVPNFCPPTVPRQQQEAIWEIRQARREKIFQARKRNGNGDDGKQIKPPAPGLTLKYLLTGLVRCGHCGRSMTPSSTGQYVTKAGETKNYPAYVCPGYTARVCPNSKRVHEEWLRESVVGILRQRLFPEGGEDGHEPDWLAPLVEDVRDELARVAHSQPGQREALQQEMKELQAKQAGWSQSLAKPDLDPAIRSAIEAEWGSAYTRQREIEGWLSEQENGQQRLDEVLDPRQVLDRLGRLPEVLAMNNPTRGNLELSLHIERIDCYEDGKVVLRTCKLGALAEAAELLKHDVCITQEDDERGADGTPRATPRRRARLRVDGDAEMKAAAHTAADPGRFAGLGEEWFWEDVLQIPRRTNWAEEHAAEVAEAWSEGLSMQQLAERFGKSRPTIRSSLRYAGTADETIKHRRKKKKPRCRWHEDHALEVAAKKAEGLGTNQLVEFFGKSDTTIRAALKHAQELSEQDAGRAGAA